MLHFRCTANKLGQVILANKQLKNILGSVQARLKFVLKKSEMVFKSFDMIGKIKILISFKEDGAHSEQPNSRMP